MFARFLRDTMIHLASDEHDISFNCFMSSKSKPPKGWKTLECILKQKHTSLNHTTGLNRILDYIDGDYIVCTDTDVAILAPNWDKFLIDQMNRENLEILGVDNWDNPRFYTKFPLVTFFIARSLSYMRAQPDLRPELVDYPNKHGIGAKIKRIKTSRDTYIYGKRTGHTILLDSGWQLPYKFKTLNMKGATLKQAKEYALQYVPQSWKFDKELGVCHKGKGSKRRQSHAMKFFGSVRHYLSKKYGVEIKK